jgi:hypothetical protein
MIDESQIPPVSDEAGAARATLGPASEMGKAELDVWIAFFAKHQIGTVEWEDGLIFNPRATVSAAAVFAGEFSNYLGLSF